MTTSLFYKNIYVDPHINSIVYSVVVPVYNQEGIITQTVKSIIEHTRDNFEVIIILDFCFDQTEKNLMDFIKDFTPSTDHFIQITIFKNNEKPLFETKCDNIGFKTAKGKYCVEIQADMIMTEPAYNLHLAKPFLKNDNIIAVSGRCAHHLFRDGEIGKMGYSIETSVEDLGIDKNKFYSYETCNRGPLLIDRKRLEEMGFLNEEEYFLENSDHDLMARAYLEKGYICGYVPINFNSPIHLGSTRNENTYNFCEEWVINNQEKDNLIEKTNSKPGLNKYKDIWVDREPVVYDI